MWQKWAILLFLISALWGVSEIAFSLLFKCSKVFEFWKGEAVLTAWLGFSVPELGDFRLKCIFDDSSDSFIQSIALWIIEHFFSENDLSYLTYFHYT